MRYPHAHRRRFLQWISAGLAGMGVAGKSSAGRASVTAPDVWSHRPEKYATDVLVVGGGPAGIGAAIASARTGVHTMVIENHAFFGGVASFGCGMPINQMRPMGEPRSVVHEQIIGGLLRYGDRAVVIGEHQLWCNVDYLRAVILDTLDDVHCSFVTQTRAADVVRDGNRITGVVIATKQGLVRIGARVVVDCTGDADVSFYAGADTMIESGNLSPYTLLLNVTGFDPEAARTVDFRRLIEQARVKYPLIPGNWGLYWFNSQVTLFINHPGTRDIGQFDGSDPDQLTQAEAVARRQAVQMVEAMREFGGEALRHIELARTGAQIGVRESRRVKGGYVLTEEDAMAGRHFDDVIAWRSGFLDIGAVRLSRMKVHDVPYRAIVPETVDGLLMAGRCISATHEAAAAGKSMGNCVATGHAAGLAASLCARRNCQPRELPVALVQDVLRKDGVKLDRAGDEQDALQSGQSGPPREFLWSH